MDSTNRRSMELPARRTARIAPWVSVYIGCDQDCGSRTENESQGDGAHIGERHESRPVRHHEHVAAQRLLRQDSQHPSRRQE